MFCLLMQETAMSSSPLIEKSVVLCVLRPQHYTKIAEAVVTEVSIFMMNNLFSRKRPS